MIESTGKDREQGMRGKSVASSCPSPRLLQAALNGTRTRAEHPQIPLSPEQLAMEASAAAAAGAGAIHVHVRDAGGFETLAPDDVSRTLDAIRAACPGTPVGISSGAWIIPDMRRRLALIDGWSVLPDFVSVNLHEAGAAWVIRLLLDKGIGVEAGIWNAPAARTLVETGLASDCLRILIEPAEGSCRAYGNLEQIEASLDSVDRPRLLHGLGPCAWEFVELAAKRCYDTRVGFEDTLTLPDGTRANSNADLVAAARRIVLAATSAAL